MIIIMLKSMNITNHSPFIVYFHSTNSRVPLQKELAKLVTENLSISVFGHFVSLFGSEGRAAAFFRLHLRSFIDFASLGHVYMSPSFAYSFPQGTKLENLVWFFGFVSLVPMIL